MSIVGNVEDVVENDVTPKEFDLVEGDDNDVVELVLGSQALLLSNCGMFERGDFDGEGGSSDNVLCDDTVAEVIFMGNLCFLSKGRII